MYPGSTVSISILEAQSIYLHDFDNYMYLLWNTFVWPYYLVYYSLRIIIVSALHQNIPNVTRLTMYQQGQEILFTSFNLIAP